MAQKLLLSPSFKGKLTPTRDLVDDLDYISEMSSHEEGHFNDADEGDEIHANNGNIDASQGKSNKIHGKNASHSRDNII